MIVGNTYLKMRHEYQLALGQYYYSFNSRNLEINYCLKFTKILLIQCRCNLSFTCFAVLKVTGFSLQMVPEYEDSI